MWNFPIGKNFNSDIKTTPIEILEKSFSPVTRNLGSLGFRTIWWGLERRFGGV